VNAALVDLLDRADSQRADRYERGAS
jgi:hypothetical protein